MYWWCRVVKDGVNSDFYKCFSDCVGLLKFKYLL